MLHGKAPSGFSLLEMAWTKKVPVALAIVWIMAGATSNRLNGGTCDIQTGMDCVEADISNEPKDTYAECCELCSATPACTAFTHNTYNARGQRQGTCYMKSACSARQPCGTCTAGTVNAPPAPTPPPTPAPPTPGISFGTPSVVGTNYDCTGFQGFDDNHALGHTEKGWRGTVDGGRTWTTVFTGTLRCAPGWPAGGTGTDEQKCLHGNSLHDGYTYVYNRGRGTPNASCSDGIYTQANCWCCRCPSDGPCTKTYPVQGGIMASVSVQPASAPASPAPASRHDFGSVYRVADIRKSYRQFNSTRNAAVFTARGGVFSAATSNRSVVFKGIPAPGFSCGDSTHYGNCPFRDSGRGYVTLADGTLVMSIIVWWGGAHANPNRALASKSTSVVAFRSADGGYTWTFAGSILDASQAPESEEGPNENDLVLLADGKTIMCVVHLDAGDGVVSHPYRPYVRVLSRDGGFTWTNATSLPKGVGCARPRLLRTDSGAIVLSGGRLGPSNGDTLVWLNSGRDGGVDWQAHSVTYWHNRLVADKSLHFTSGVNSSDARQTMSYTSLVRTGPQTGFVVYARRLAGTPDTAFSMPFAVGSSVSGSP